MINRERFDAELVAAGVVVVAFNADGPAEGRAVLEDGTIVPTAWDGASPLGHERGGIPSPARATAYRAVLLAHNNAETAAQLARRRMGLQNVALAVVLKRTYALAPAWCQNVVDALDARAGEGS